MKFMDDVKAAASGAADGVSQQANAARLRYSLSNLEKSRLSLYAQLGEAAYEQIRTDKALRARYESVIGQLEESERQIQDLRHELSTYGHTPFAEVATCPSCGRLYLQGDAFCMFCGYQIPAQQPQPQPQVAAQPQPQMQPQAAAPQPRMPMQQPQPQRFAQQPQKPSHMAPPSQTRTIIDRPTSSPKAEHVRASAIPLVDEPSAPPVTSEPAKTERRCPRCGRVTVAGGAFCGHCGTKLS
ncbi:MAG: zinc ribbon domain-containing protein [Coriobacteriales bacterium]|nr:zinc ribbon domain-containing protein [Coriobacteriales bacterium]